MRDVTFRANEQLKTVEEDISALSYLLATLNEAETERAQSSSGAKAANEDQDTSPRSNNIDITSLYTSEEARVPALEDAESVRELLQKLEAAEEIASGVEGKVDALLSGLEELLSSMVSDVADEVDQTGNDEDDRAVEQSEERKDHEEDAK
ncbi:SubName: Full=Uncharacterized protein {ECO:0000313/EMBL:CCA75022.1} [Serendipita indica DSM 11827]|uniref:Uncharacterized protein n=1 Tax=Serendipita indica (strain DSM 11827) TaxID=1109443 RepID=G4TUM9_SERID|nr:SubName: Full=Uncharacterized protein {ECO:0000313/EMBL:CCA75022.1} [Serendipita indica DSM 11827]CCA75022.1 hypothetical protein PIIN_09007 [Serendipita indica DSM 11827]